MGNPSVDVGGNIEPPLRDARLRSVQRTAFWLLLLAVGGLSLLAVLHWLDTRSPPLSRIMPPLLATAFAVLSWHHHRHPQRLVTTMWAAWWLLLVGLATPAWWFIGRAIDGPQRLVDSLPPIGAAFLPTLLVMALFARARQAWIASAVAWMLVALPVLLYLLAHPDELATPRGIELVIALGPVGLVVPLLIPLLRGVEHEFVVLRAERERLQALAERDVLIGLYNRRAGEKFLSALLAHSRRQAALILFDIDHFKRINDRFGHPAGDAVLIEVGRRCAGQLGAQDVFAR